MSVKHKCVSVSETWSSDLKLSILTALIMSDSGGGESSQRGTQAGMGAQTGED